GPRLGHLPQLISPSYPSYHPFAIVVSRARWYCLRTARRWATLCPRRLKEEPPCARSLRGLAVHTFPDALWRSSLREPSLWRPAPRSDPAALPPLPRVSALLLPLRS